MARRKHLERHKVGRLGWLRAAVLGANDGLLSTASLIIGVASAPATHSAILIAGVAALIAGAMSMAAGEYVSVSSQADSENADLKREAAELKDDPASERNELAGIYVKRGLDPELANRVAEQLMAKDALKAHARDELGLSEENQARPFQAAMASAISFAFGAAPPLAVAALAPQNLLVACIAVISLAVLALLGGLGARAGGAPIAAAIVRVTFWGGLAMLVTSCVGRLFGTTVS
jgi:VIT1/CCC1 family predicted Fe2+/Mn2+ transporter